MGPPVRAERKPAVPQKTGPNAQEALRRRLAEMAADIPALQRRHGGPQPSFINGSQPHGARQTAPQSFDTVITSPPYANRYDYTRTYALELPTMATAPRNSKS